MIQRTIYVNGRFLTQRTTGVQRFAMNLLQALDEELSETNEFQIILLKPRNTIVQLKLRNIPQKQIGRFTGHVWEQIELPFYSRNQLLINLCNIGPALKINQFVNICDAAVFRFPDAYKFIFVIWYRLLAHLNSWFSKKIITISEFSKSELMHFLHLHENKISIIYPAVHFSSLQADDLIVEKLQIRKRGYLLAVGSLDSRKNFKGVIEAFAQLESQDIELVIVGGGYSKVFSNQKMTADQRIKWTGYLTDAELISLYSNAAAFVYPSFYEGFGIPPLEAMSFGCPVIVSQVASLPEVCEEAVLYCDPYQSTSIRDAMQILLTNPALRNELIKKGNQQFLKFSYRKSSRHLLSILRK